MKKRSNLSLKVRTGEFTPPSINSSSERELNARNRPAACCFLGEAVNNYSTSRRSAIDAYDLAHSSQRDTHRYASERKTQSGQRPEVPQRGGWKRAMAG